MQTTNNSTAMKYSTIKQIKTFCDNLNIDDWRGVVESIDNQEDDFEINGYRFIEESMIDQIQRDELSSDEYMLGCFKDWFIAEYCNIPLRAVQALQKAEAYSELGEMMLENGIDELQKEYASADGYGHHFAHYDSNERSILDYLVFRVN